VKGVRHDLPAFYLGERPLPARYHLRRRVVGTSHKQHRLRVIEITARIGTVRAVGKQLDLARSSGLEAHKQFPRNRATSRLRVGDMDAHKPIDCRDVMLPTAPHDSVAMAHQKPISAIERHTGGDGPCDAIEHRERQPVASVYHVEQQAAAAAFRVLGSQDPHICSKSDTTIAIARRKIEVGNATVTGMARVDGKMCCAVEL